MKAIQLKQKSGITGRLKNAKEESVKMKSSKSRLFFKRMKKNEQILRLVEKKQYQHMYNAHERGKEEKGKRKSL